MRRTVTLTTTALLAIVLAACTGAGASPSPSAAAPTVAPSVAASDAASVAPSPSATPDACAKENLALTTPGVLTIGADNPAFPPYYDFPGDGETATDPWESGDPTNGRGFESATAYAIAEALGFTKAEVTWIPVPFNNAIQPGEKDFDLYLTQVSYSDERAQAVDLTEGYFDLTQAVVSLADNPITKVTTKIDPSGREGPRDPSRKIDVL